MITTLPATRDRPGRIVLVGECGTPLATDLRGAGHLVDELLASDFVPAGRSMADIVAVLPACPDAARVGGIAASCARCVWFQEQAAPPGLARLLQAAGVPCFEGRDLREECLP
ncbi:MAG: hypothetical protein MUE73_06765 [Planctomycetes bacterium]|jgi:hypothetical protein|nr:hypothetical protein [Planctomycetota bacterium]